MAELPSGSKLVDKDEQWARMMEMEMEMEMESILHHGLVHPEADKAGYMMKDGCLPTKGRAALAEYVLRHWGVDASDDHRLAPSSRHLWLRNQ